jgi:hypothetical protein
MITNVDVYGFENAIKCSKYPMSVDISTLNTDITNTVKKLGNAQKGSGHDNFLKGIIVQFDLTMTPKMSIELERYHFIDFISSQSTMHRITKFDLDKAYIEYVDKRIIDIMKDKVNEYNKLVELTKDKSFYDNNKWDIENEKEYKDVLNNLYLEILYSNPCGFKLTAGMTTNYQQLKTIYYQRKNHKLPEWRTFCEWIETLPYFKEICLED